MASSSIDQPTVTSSGKIGDPTKLTTVGSGVSCACRIGVFDQNLGDFDILSHWIAVLIPDQIHDVFNTMSTSGGVNREGNLKIFAPLGYYFLTPTEVLRDLLTYYGHAQAHRTIQLSPNGDGSPQGWGKTGGVYYYENINTPTRLGPDGTFSLTTTTPGVKTRLEFSNYGNNNISKVHEIRVRLWGRMLNGSDAGMTFKVRLYDPTGQIDVARHIDMKFGSTWTYGEVWFENLEQTNTNFNSLEVEIEAFRGYAGGSPNPYWQISNMDIAVVWFPVQHSLFDSSSFSDLDSYFTDQTPDYELDGDFYDVTVREAMMEVLAHTPEIYLYLANDAQLTCAKLAAYSTESTPKVFGFKQGNLIKINRIYAYTERIANSIEVKFDAKAANSAEETAESDPEPINDILTDLDAMSAAQITERKLDLSRRLFREESVSDQSKDMTSVFSANYMEIWGDDVKAVDIVVTMECLEVKPGDIVAFNDETLGYDERKFTCVARDIDFDKLEGRLLLYDIEFSS